MAASGASGVMVGRGAQGRPWLLGQIGDVLAGGIMRAAPSIRVRHELMQAHLDDDYIMVQRQCGWRANILLGMPMACRGAEYAVSPITPQTRRLYLPQLISFLSFMPRRGPHDDEICIIDWRGADGGG